jgi:hypothetical protein
MMILLTVLCAHKDGKTHSKVNSLYFVVDYRELQSGYKSISRLLKSTALFHRLAQQTYLSIERRLKNPKGWSFSQFVVAVLPRTANCSTIAAVPASPQE